MLPSIFLTFAILVYLIAWGKMPIDKAGAVSIPRPVEIAHLGPEGGRAVSRTPRSNRERISLTLRTTTPILGGAPTLRTVDDIDVIRVPTIRGHLRFWWRALNAHKEAYLTDGVLDHLKLAKAESDIWGQASDASGGRSAVDVRIKNISRKEPDSSKVVLYGSKATPGAYALWPAASAEAPRQPDVRFDLELLVPNTAIDHVRSALKAWVLFGGYGSRVRRGLGSLKVDEHQDWLPSGLNRDGLQNVFGTDILADTASEVGDVPLLAGADLCYGEPHGSAENAWTQALGWLKAFRQETSSGARVRGDGKPNPTRPSISNWPEADYIRLASTPPAKKWTHQPRYSEPRAWPRAGFGLPIVGQFQTTDRTGEKNRYIEPKRFELRWHDGQSDHSRLSSALIVKAVALADGKFVPCALWLNRAYPANGKVYLYDRANRSSPIDKKIVEKTDAFFDATFNVPERHNIPDFVRTASENGLRHAFMNWLITEKRLHQSHS